MDQIDSMAKRVGLQNPSVFRRSALARGQKRRIGITTVVLLRALVWAEKHPGRRVRLVAYTRYYANDLRDRLRAMAERANVDLRPENVKASSFDTYRLDRVGTRDMLFFDHYVGEDRG